MSKVVKKQGFKKAMITIVMVLLFANLGLMNTMFASTPLEWGEIPREEAVRGEAIDFEIQSVNEIRSVMFWWNFDDGGTAQTTAPGNNFSIPVPDDLPLGINVLDIRVEDDATPTNSSSRRIPVFVVETPTEIEITRPTITAPITGSTTPVIVTQPVTIVADGGHVGIYYIAYAWVQAPLTMPPMSQFEFVFFGDLDEGELTVTAPPSVRNLVLSIFC